MIHSVQVLVVIDDVNKVYYTEKKSFAAGSEEYEKALSEYYNLLFEARRKGYQINEIEKTNNPISEVEEIALESEESIRERLK